MMNNWFDTILDYNFDVIHLKGIDNVLPDHLSRLFPDEQRLEGVILVNWLKINSITINSINKVL